MWLMPAACQTVSNTWALYCECTAELNTDAAPTTREEKYQVDGLPSDGPSGGSNVFACVARVILIILDLYNSLWMLIFTLQDDYKILSCMRGTVSQVAKWPFQATYEQKLSRNVRNAILIEKNTLF